LYIRIFEKYIEYFPYAVSFCVHDDWGSQKETFFSPAVASEMIVPYMRKVTDYLHSQGKFCEIHSCGQAFKQVPNFIAAGWDSWSGQAMNDTAKIYEEYGDKIILGVYPEPFDIEATSEEKQRELGREFADKFAKPGKPATLNGLGVGLTVPFFEGLYKQSRLNYAK
ncbi:MAG: methyltransferase, partial [Clostridiales bacterium]|nr:methyltransferase [Clostridiales bacterium]